MCGSGTVLVGGQKAEHHPVLDRIAAAAAPPRLSSFGNRLTCKFLHQPAMRRSSKTLGGFERCITTPRWQMFFGGKKTEEVSRGAAVKRCRNLLFFFFFLQINNSQFNSSLFPTLPAPALPFSANHKTCFHSQAAVTQVNFQFI